MPGWGGWACNAVVGLAVIATVVCTGFLSKLHDRPRNKLLLPRDDAPLCRDFLQGRCSWGSRCRFVHTKLRTANRPSESENIFSSVNSDEIITGAPKFSREPPVPSLNEPVPWKIPPEELLKPGYLKKMKAATTANNSSNMTESSLNTSGIT
mmetsp:Transcript_32486/g.52781  ORF Transcript_32486/g.52781 Transcript_32486/m.52781 type:complete len:152 (+) Transcript_32486:32-487(+)